MHKKGYIRKLLDIFKARARPVKSQTRPCLPLPLAPLSPHNTADSSLCRHRPIFSSQPHRLSASPSAPLQMCEDLEDMEGLRHMARLVRGIILLNDAHLLDTLLGEEYIMDVVRIPARPQRFRPASRIARPARRRRCAVARRDRAQPPGEGEVAAWCPLPPTQTHAYTGY